MAELIPKQFRGSNVGERRVYHLLHDALPDDHLVYHDRPIRVRGGGERHPDFIVVAPELGVVVLEVKDFPLSCLHEATSDTIGVGYGKGVGRHPHPLRQARGYVLQLSNRFSEHGCVLHAGGLHKGRLVFPYGYAAILSRIGRRQLCEKFGPVADEIFPAQLVICADELAQFEDDHATVRDFLARLMPFPLHSALTDVQLRAIRAVISPHAVISPRAPVSPAPEAPVTPRRVRDETLRVLDVQQEQLAESIGRGHRVILGVAGSGKTVLLAARARLLAARRPEARILVLTYNIVLARALRSRIAADTEGARVEVTHYHAWVRGKAERRTDYDAILIDEAQDFEPAWFEEVVAALRDPAEGDLLIVGDGAQAIYRGGAFTWKSVGVKAVGRTSHLRRNYRNTRPILELAYGLIAEASGQEGDEQAFAPVPPEASLREGEEPEVVECASREAEVEHVADWVRGLLEGRDGKPLRESEIAILYPSLGRDKRHLERLIAQLASFCRERPLWVSQSRESKLAYRDGRGGVRLSTIHSAKGLEFPGVACIWADRYPRDDKEQEESGERRLLYVGLTRACDRLLVTWVPTGAARFARSLARAALGLPHQSEHRPELSRTGARDFDGDLG